MKLHAMLRRQLKKLGLDEVTPPQDAETWNTLLDCVAHAYEEGEKGRALLERSVAVSSDEMQRLGVQYHDMFRMIKAELVRKRKLII